MRTVTSELLKVPGIGDAKRRALLAAFGSLQGVRDAPIEAIAALPGFGRKTADRIVAALRESSPLAPAAADAVPESSDSQLDNQPAVQEITTTDES
jgi:excinuclease ABC subunit C